MPVQWVCGCSRVVLHQHDDRKVTDRYLALCEECVQNNGDYTKSSAWKPDPEREQPHPLDRKPRRRDRNGLRMLDGKG